MNTSECQFVIDQFLNANPNVLMNEFVIGVIIKFENKKNTLQVLVKEESFIKVLSQEISIKEFSYQYEKEQKSMAFLIISSTMPTAHATPVKAGQKAQPVNHPYYGTAGWNIFLNGTLVCVSNWHVLCKNGNSSQIGERIKINDSEIASLYAYEPINFGGAYNIWDYALAKYDNSNDVLGDMETCQNGNIYPYPQQLTSNVNLGDGKTYHKVGARTPTCRSGELNGYGIRKISYASGQSAWFQNQLIFSKMSDPGDSGSVIVRDDDNTVTGLNFAGNSNETIANPLYSANWEYIGVYKYKDGREFPIYDKLQVQHLANPLGDLITTNTNQVSPQSIPELVAGKVFLKLCIGSFDLRTPGLVVGWFKGMEPPPPLSGRGPVVIVPGGLVTGYAVNYDPYNTARIGYFLCFG